MKRIIIFSALDLWSMSTGTGAPSFFKTVDAYVKDGWDVVLVNPNSTNDTSYTAENFHNYPVKELIKKNFKSKVFKFISNLVNSIHFTNQFVKIGEKNILDSDTILYAYEVHAVKAVNKLSKKYNNRIVTRFQGTILSRVENTLVNRVGYYPHFQALKEKSDLVIMTDDGTFGKRVLDELGNTSKIMFWRNGVDIKQRKSGDSALDSNELKRKYNIGDEKVLMTVSRVVNWKRIDRAIKLTKELLTNGYNVRLLVVGDGPDVNNLQEYANQLNIQDKVCFVGAVEQEMIPEYLAIADVFLSLYDLSNLGNPLFEAMKCGKAIVTLNNGDTSSVITNGENAVMLEMEDFEQLPKAVETILDDSEFSQKISNGAKEYAEQNFYSWEKRMNMEIEAVSSLLK